MSSIITRCRAALGPAPRSFGWWDRLTYLGVSRPEWMYEGDPLVAQFAQRQQVLQTGAIVWGRLIHGANEVFHPGERDHPGAVVYCPSENYDLSDEDLGETAELLYHLQLERPGGELGQLAAMLADETKRILGLPVPTAFCPRAPCVVSTVFFVRRHLPNGRVAGPGMPLVVGREPPYNPVVLPSKYWPADLLADWRSRG